MTRHVSTVRRLGMIAVLAFLSVLGTTRGPVPSIALAAGSSDCGCTGAYVDPAVSSGVSPVTPVDSSSAYALSVSASAITVNDKKTGARVVNIQLDGDFHAGFDPAGTRLAVWGVAPTQEAFVQLYNLTARAAQTPVWRQDSLSGSLVLGFSGQGKYLMAIVQDSASTATAWVVNAASGAVAFNNQIPAGSGHVFSPDEDRFVITTASGGVSHIGLYDLAAKRYAWQGDVAAGSIASFFSPHGKYFGTAEITNGSHVDLTVRAAASSGSGYSQSLLSPSFQAAGPPGAGKDAYGYAGWGFSPDSADSTFVYAAADGGNGVTLAFTHFVNQSMTATYSAPSIASGFWQFSPCGDMLAIVTQATPTSGATVLLYATSVTSPTMTPVAAQDFSSPAISLKATSAWHVATVNGTDYNLAHNAGCNGTPSGGNGGGNGSGGGPTNGGGSGNGSGNGGSGGVLPPPVVPARLTGITLDSPVTLGGSTVAGTLQLLPGNYGTTITLTSSDPSALSVPASIFVNAGTSTVPFTAAAGNVAQDEIVTVAATVSGTAVSTRVAIKAACAAPVTTAAASVRSASLIPGGDPRPMPTSPSQDPRSITAFTVDPLIVSPNATSTGTVAMAQDAVKDETITLTSSNPSVAGVPASVIVPKGADGATFPITAQPVSAASFVTITARSGVRSVRSVTMVVVPTPAVASLTFDPSTVAGGDSATGTVTLQGPVITCDPVVVELSGGEGSAASFPSTVTVPQGATSVTFSVTTQPVDADRNVMVTASLGGSSASGTLTVKQGTPGLSNDFFAHAMPLGTAATLTGDTNSATIEPGEQVLSGTCYVLPWHHLENSVWFKITPTQSGTLTMSTANPGTNFDTVLALYTDPGTSDIADLSTPIGCDNNGDQYPATEHTGPGGPLTPTWSSIFHVPVQAGQTYYLQLGGVGGAPFGHYVLTTSLS